MRSLEVFRHPAQFSIHRRTSKEVENADLVHLIMKRCKRCKHTVDIMITKVSVFSVSILQKGHSHREPSGRTIEMPLPILHATVHATIQQHG